jgi:DNA-binding transcriptional MerR regulator
MTVDELARAAGTSTRNVRALQTRGLLPGPTLVGRTGEYDHDHLGRLQAILRLQARGFSRAAIRELLAAWEAGAGLEDVLGLPSRRARRPAVPASGFEDLVDSLPQWRGPRAGLLPGPLAQQLSN